jgi:predicted DNA-binding protein (MmcQ/YjbR family)
MTRAEFDRFCASLPAAHRVVQWGGAHVWKVGGKVFAICSDWRAAGEAKALALPGITFKTSPLSYEMLSRQPGLRPAPYLASRGLKWIQRHARPGLGKADLKRYLAESHRLVAAGLSRAQRRELGLEQDVPSATPRRTRRRRVSP